MIEFAGALINKNDISIIHKGGESYQIIVVSISNSFELEEVFESEIERDKRFCQLKQTLTLGAIYC